jgi:ribonuclease BN (tRNA processing enzyme)
MKQLLRGLFVPAVLALATAAHAEGCPTEGLALQVLGSGHGQMGERAAPSYLVRLDGKARLLIDAGTGTALRFGQSGARFDDLDAVLLSQLGASHSIGLPGLLASGHHAERTRPLPIYGPAGDKLMPSTISFVRILFDDKRGAWRELGVLLSPLDRIPDKLEPRDIRVRMRGPDVELETQKTNPLLRASDLEVSVQPAISGRRVVLVWRVGAAGKSVVVANSAVNAEVANLAAGSDLLLLGETMNPQQARVLAVRAGSKQLLVAERHLDNDREAAFVATIAEKYAGTITLTDDLACYKP